MSERITAWENVYSDFHWIGPFLIWIGEQVSNFGSLIALAGVVWLFYATKKKERVEEERQQKRILYSDFLGIIESVYVRGEPPAEGKKLWAKLYSSTSLIQVLGDEKVHSQACRAISALMRLTRKDHPEVISIDGKQRTKADDYIWERGLLIEVMQESLKK